MSASIKARIAAFEAEMALVDLEEIKGGPGSGNWGHAGRPGKRGGSMSRKVAMSRTTGRDWQKRQAAARGGKPKPKGKKPKSLQLTQAEIDAIQKKAITGHKQTVSKAAKTRDGIIKSANVMLEQANKILEESVNLPPGTKRAAALNRARTMKNDATKALNKAWGDYNAETMTARNVLHQH